LVEDEANREAKIYASQSGQTGTGGETGRLALEQLLSLRYRSRRSSRDRVGVDGKETGADGNAVAGEGRGEFHHLWRQEAKTPPKQNRLGWGTLEMVGWATLPFSRRKDPDP